MIGVGFFLIVIVICLIGITFEMNQVDEVIEDTAQDYWDEYWEREEEDGCEDFFATTEETGLHDNE